MTEVASEIAEQPKAREEQRPGYWHSLPLFYVVAFGALFLERAASLIAHFLGPSPYGGPLVISPGRFIPDACMVEAGTFAATCLSFAALERWFPPLRVRAAFLWVVVSYLALAQFDLEVVRWLGQHVSVSYLQNYFGIKDQHLLWRILSSDLPFTSLSVSFVLAAGGVAGALHQRRHRFGHLEARSWWLVAAFVTVVLATAPIWYRSSEKRWPRIRPVGVILLNDAWRSLSGAERPHDVQQARRDLVSFIESGQLAQSEQNGTELDPQYPLWRNDNVSGVSVEEFSKHPEQQLNVVVIMFETLRGWKTGFLDSQQIASQTPELDRLLGREALVFPWAHSNGFPSVEGCVGLHLGLWSHFRKIVINDYGHTHTEALPEMLRRFGYRTFALLGADPSFDNFTPWMRRWYDAFEYQETRHHDGPLVDRAIEKYAELRDQGKPTFFMMWTATTHPPYDIPAGGPPVATDVEERYDQAAHYADHHLTRFLEYLKSRDDYKNTVIVILGDHAQPTPYQRIHSDLVGDLGPGHTWTTFAFLSGSAHAPKPAIRSETVSQVDIAPTLLSILGVKAPNHFMGRNLLEPGERPALAFRNNDISYVTGNERVDFAIGNDTVRTFTYDRNDKRQYGLLEGNGVTVTRGAPSGVEVDRIRDMVLYYGSLLDQDRIMPPE